MKIGKITYVEVGVDISVSPYESRLSIVINPEKEDKTYIAYYNGDRIREFVVCNMIANVHCLVGKRCVFKHDEITDRIEIVGIEGE